MKNFVQPGDIVTVTAPYDVNSGDGLKVGSLVGIATNKALSGSLAEAKLCGVHDVTKAAGAAWAEGAIIYWDDTAKNFTTTATSNTKVGVAVLPAAASADVIGRVRLNGSF
jgi:predicted RecA/RadA family phage recombinase